MGTTALPTYDDCFVCGQHHPRGLRTRFRATEHGEVEAEFSGDPTLAGYDGVVHGGVVAALLDELTGWAVSLRHDLLACTGELTVRFAQPVRVGSTCRGRSRVKRGRGRVWEAEGELTDENGNVLAKAQGTYFLLSEEQTAELASRMRYQPGDLRVFRGDRIAMRTSEQEGEKHVRFEL